MHLKFDRDARDLGIILMIVLIMMLTIGIATWAAIPAVVP
jgi:Tfp pilus assembly protein PilX